MGFGSDIERVLGLAKKNNPLILLSKISINSAHFRFGTALSILGKDPTS
jgi:hypothetical protein